MKNQEVESNLVERFTSGDTFNMVMVNTAILVSLALLNALIKKLLQITGPVNYKLVSRKFNRPLCINLFNIIH